MPPIEFFDTLNRSSGAGLIGDEVKPGTIFPKRRWIFSASIVFPGVLLAPFFPCYCPDTEPLPVGSQVRKGKYSFNSHADPGTSVSESIK
jgi:hypothetical protein